MHTWDPDRYLTYADERGRPFVELLARVDAADPATVVDLGCGPGNLTALLVERWPGARVVGLDSSAEMIEKARATTPAVDFRVADLRDWATGADQVDVLVSNATLQWVPGHLELLPDLVARVNPGGWLAFQVPGNFDEPSHTIRAELAAQAPYAEHTAAASPCPTRTTPRSTCTPCAGSAARSTPGRRRTSTSSTARTRCSPGSRAPGPGRRSRRCPTTSGSASRRSSSGGCGRRTRIATGAWCCRSAASSSWAGDHVIALHHVQVACPSGGEDAARAFYADGLGLVEVEKPADLRARGGAWFRAYGDRGDVLAELHVGVEEPFVPARKAHPAFVVDDLDAVAARLREGGFEVDERERTTFEGYLRFHAFDPHGNRVEVLERLAA